MPSNKRKNNVPVGTRLKEAYSNVAIVPQKSVSTTVRADPDSPRFYFSTSYDITNVESDCNNGEDREYGIRGSLHFTELNIPQVVHKHVNGLYIVTAGDILSSASLHNRKIKSIQFVAKEAPHCSAAVKRKRQAKMLKGSKVDDVVEPSDVIAELIVENDDMEAQSKEQILIPLRACVWGTILEINKCLTPENLVEDPLLDGYLAIILPSGDFPPGDIERN